MANVINTRIQLKYDTLANWQEKNPTLLSGEIAIATVGNSHTTTTPDNGTHPVVFKVGPGAYNSLPFTSALAADVYAWAKEATLTVNKDGEGNVVAGIEWDATANGGKGGLKYTTASVATSEGLKAVQDAIKAINDELDTFGDIVTHNAAEFATKSEFDTLKGKVEDEDGALAKANSAYALAETKLATATFTEFQTTNAQAIADAKSGAEATAAGELTKARGEITTEIGNAVAPLATKTELNGVKETAEAAAPQATTYTKTEVNNLVAPLATTEALNGVKATAEAAAPQATTYNKTEVDSKVKTAKDAADAAQGTANEAKTKIDTFLGTITPDGSADIIDTLAEINTNINENTDAFTGLSTRVTNIENGATKAGDADKLDGHDSDYFATATALEGVKATAEAAAPKTTVYTKTEVDTKLGDWTIEDPTGEQPPIEATGLRGEIEDKVNEVNEALENYKLYNDDRITHIVAGDEAVGRVANKLTVTGGGEYVTGVEFDGSAAKTLDLTTLTDTVKGTFNVASIASTNASGALTELDAFFEENEAGKGDVTYNKVIEKITAAQTAANTANENIGKLHEIATTGSIYDVAEGANTSTGTDTGVEYLIFNCGSASTII